MEDWRGDGAADGFNILALTYPDGLDDFVDQVIPILRRRGLFREGYVGGTLRENLGLAVPENRWTAQRMGDPAVTGRG